MQLSRNDAVVYVPDRAPLPDALARTTHLAVGAHQDDLEIMAVDGILRCYESDTQWFAGVVVSDGAGSPRAGHFADYSNDRMVAARVDEQKRAADIGRYGAQVLLLHPSGDLKDASRTEVLDDLAVLLEAARPDVVYTHNLFDKHDAHVAVALRLIGACRRLAPGLRPSAVYGCEVWRDLDWLPDSQKMVFDVSERPDLQERLLAQFESQIAGGKRYDLAAMGRRRAHATYLDPHKVDDATGAIYACDMTPLVRDASAEPAVYAHAILNELRHDVAARIDRVG